MCGLNRTSKSTHDRPIEIDRSQGILQLERAAFDKRQNDLASLSM